MRKIFPTFLFLFPYLLFAQTVPVVIEGIVTDISHKPIAYSAIESIEFHDGSVADIAGHYIFRTTLPATLKVSYIGYKSEIRKIIPALGKDTLQIDFILIADSTQLQQVVVTADNEPELITESDNLKDFDLSNGKLLLLFDYSKGDKILIYDTGSLINSTIQLKYHTEKLFRNERQDIYFPHGDSVQFLTYNHHSNLFESFSLSKFLFATFKQVRAYNSPYYYYEQMGNWNSEVNYYYYNPMNKKQKVLYSYFDGKI